MSILFPNYFFYNILMLWPRGGNIYNFAFGRRLILGEESSLETLDGLVQGGHSLTRMQPSNWETPNMFHSEGFIPMP